MNSRGVMRASEWHAQSCGWILLAVCLRAEQSEEGRDTGPGWPRLVVASTTSPGVYISGR